MSKRFIKDPDSQVDYIVDWQKRLVDGDYIIKSEFKVPDSLIWISDSYTSSSTKIWLAGGIAGETYLVTNRITTGSRPPRIEEESIEIVCQEK